MTVPLPLIALLNVTALGSLNTSAALSSTGPAAHGPDGAVAPPSASVPAEMVVPPD